MKDMMRIVLSLDLREHETLKTIETIKRKKRITMKYQNAQVKRLSQRPRQMICTEKGLKKRILMLKISSMLQDLAQ